jgi:hypothetical protein
MKESARIEINYKEFEEAKRVTSLSYSKMKSFEGSRAFDSDTGQSSKGM